MIQGLELASWHSFPTKLYISTVGHGTETVKTLIAAILILVQISSPLCSIGWGFWSFPLAKVVLYSPDTKVPRTGELALRRAIPANTNMKTIQTSLEDISFLLKIPQRKPYGTMEGNVKKALKIVMDEKDSIMGSIAADLKEKGSTLYASLIDRKVDSFFFFLFARVYCKLPDKVSVGLASSLDTVAELELLQVIAVPVSGALLFCRLTWRGTIELTIEKADGSTSSPEAGGEQRKTTTIQVIDGAYDGARLSCTDQAVLTENGVDKLGYKIPWK
ncbi:hypothetical protein Dsin_022548 [Dipteronia sinensis]|uniref:Peptidyl-prolyl cis-trans isomerase CYP38-like PsbQ-like domain-containing protein n=1 Tax=Dipteronia sinensis TaxID=43782 RepID=A0AAE0DZX3_9ROSI|nr:hypothetical protein Dsin_022548 [Dipteronia sinensis]